MYIFQDILKKSQRLKIGIVDTCNKLNLKICVLQLYVSKNYILNQLSCYLYLTALSEPILVTKSQFKKKHYYYKFFWKLTVGRPDTGPSSSVGQALSRFPLPLINI